MKKRLLRRPSPQHIAGLLQAWRFWFLSAILGALLGGLAYFVFPPSFRAQATLLVDQNVEQVIPQERSDLLIYTYLQRETDKLVELAWSDQTLADVSSQTGIPVADLRDGRLHLSQPSDGGWHFLADAPDPATASAIASVWAQVFVDQVQSKPAGISTLLEINLTQGQDLPVKRAVSMGVYVFSGALLGTVLLAFGMLFFDRKEA